MTQPARGVIAGLPTKYKHGHGPRERREAHHLWKGGRTLRRGYAYVYLPDHPSADSKGYVAEHRIVWERANGRALRSDEDIHHINGIKDDNRPENLVALTKAQHIEAHLDRTIRNFRAAKLADPEHNAKAGRKGAAARWKKP